MLTPAEVTRWRRFYERWPFDDLHRYYRPAALVSAALHVGDSAALTELVEARLEWLEAPMLRAVDTEAAGAAGGGYAYTEADRATLAAFGL